jgi:hypothetical protein
VVGGCSFVGPTTSEKRLVFALALACGLSFPGETVRANGFVFVVGLDGRLLEASDAPHAQGPVSCLADTQSRDPEVARFLFAEPGCPEQRTSAPLSASAVSSLSPEVLHAIETTALRYGSHEALRQAGLSVTDWALLYRANIEVESGYNPVALSPVGAIGLGQLMPGTARDLAVDPHDIAQNLDGSARYLLMMLAQFGDPALAIAAYNAGPHAVTRHGGIPPFRETQAHVARVTAVFQRLRGDLS